jgi:predicted RNase H-like HicB family nuclease
MKAFEIYIEWDAEASVWYVVKSDVPGLHAEAGSQEEMLEVLKDIVPELVVANVFSRDGKNVDYKQVPFSLIARREESVAIGH